nr:hypothetical protein [Tanacetum cinerariifolium]
YKPEDTQELFRELSNDVQNIHEELAEYINTPGWNRPAFYDDDNDDDVDYTITIAPVLSTEEPIDSLKISSGSTTTHFDISLSDYKAFSFNNDHIKEISSGSTTTHSNISLSEYDSFTFDLSNDQCPPTDKSEFTHEKFADELTHIISPSDVNLPIEDDHSPLLAYVVWIFLAYLTYPVIPLYLHPFGNEDTIFDPGITINRVYSFKPSLSHRCEAFKKFNTHRSHLNECPMIINGKNIPILDVLLFHFYPP